MQRNIAFEALRVIFIVFMILHHLDTFGSIDIPSFSETVKKICFEGFVGVNFFFMLSGLGCVLGYKDKLDNKEMTGGDFLYNRLTKLYPAYLIFLLSAVFLYNHWHISNIEVFLTHVFMLQTFPITSDIAFSFNGVAWCVSASIFFYLIFIGLHKINFKQCVYILCGVLLFVSMNLLYHDNSPFVMTALFYTNPIFRMVDFLTGMAIALWFREHPIKFGSPKLQLLSILVFVIFILVGAFSDMSWLYKWGLWYVLPCALLLIAFYNETKFSKMLFKHKFWLILSEISMIIFLSHQQILNIVKIYFPISKVPEFYNLFWPYGVLVMIIVIIGLSYVVNKFITQPLSKKLINLKNHK